MSEEIWSTIIIAVQAVLVAGLGVIGVRIRTMGRDTKVIRGEVRNSHSTNLREELDDRFQQQMSAITNIQTQVSQMNQRDIHRTSELLDINKKLSAITETVNNHVAWSDQYVREHETAWQDFPDRVRQLEDSLTAKEK